MSYFYPKVVVDAKQDRRFIEHFIIFGGPYTDYFGAIPLPEILNIFPYAPLLLDPESIHQLTTFCFPSGFRPLSEKEMKKEDPILDFFIFRIGGAEIPYYAVCAKIHVNCYKKLPFFATSSSANFPFVFCLVTSLPIFSTHFKFLQYMTQFLHKPKTSRITLPGVKELAVIKGPTLPSMDTKYGIGTCPKIEPSKSFFKQINLYRSITQNKNEALVFDLCGKMTLTIPKITEESKTIAQACLDLLFSLLSIEDIISIYASALVGNYVIFKSESPRYISFCVLALCSLIFPYPIHTPILPIVPDDEKYTSLLDSPVPFICGVLTSTNLDHIEIDSSATIVNLDEAVIEHQSRIDVPYMEDQVKYIRDVFEEEKENILVPQRTTKDSIFSQPKPNPMYDEFFEKHIDPMSLSKEYYLAHQQKYIFNESTVDKIRVIFSQRIGPWLSLVKEEIGQLGKM